MGKAEELMKAVGGAIIESASSRPDPVALPGGAQAVARPAAIPGVARSKAALEVPIDRIVRDESQPREQFDEEALDRLAASLKASGQIQPVAVRLDQGRGVYVLIAGERRWRAAARAGLTTLSCVVREAPETPEELLALQLVENALREDLRPIEQARAYKRLMEAHGWSGAELARQLHIAKSGVAQALALLDLPEGVQGQVESGHLAPSTAYEVAKIEDPADQATVAQVAVEQGLRRSEVAELAQAVRAKRPAPSARPARPAPAEFDLGDGVLVKVTYRRPSTMPPSAALRRAAKLAVDRERGQGVDAA